METIILKQSFQLNLAGAPDGQIHDCAAPSQLGVVPSAYPFVKPKLLVKEGDKIEGGAPLFFDKKNEKVQFVSPGSGTIKQIVYGERRAVDEIVIDLDSKESFVQFPKLTPDALKSLKKEDLTDQLVKGGMWPLFRSLPFRNIPVPGSTPSSIIVTIENDEPFLPHSTVYMADTLDDFIFGVRVLETLVDKVYVCVSTQNEQLKSQLAGVITHQVEGQYPAHDAGVILHHVRKTPEDNHAWALNGQSLLSIVDFLKNGQFPTHKVITVAGECFESPSHYRVRQGTSLFDLSKLGLKEGPARYIAGGIFTGRTASKDSYLNLDEYALTLMKDGHEPEFLSFMRPGFDKPSYFKTFLSTLMPNKDWQVNTAINGGFRSCVACSECPNVCPVGLYPQLILRSLTQNDYETAMDQGLLDCTECGMCSYICPSKIDLVDKFKDAKAHLYQESLA